MNAPAGGTGPAWVRDLRRLDAAVYAAVADTPTPTLDRWLRGLSRAADYSRLSLASAALLSALGGPAGQARGDLGAGVGRRRIRRG